MRRAGWRGGNRGFILISSYLLLFVFVLYSNALTVQTMNQRTVADRVREELQAVNLAQGALEQLGDEFYRFLTVEVYQLAYQGDAVKALAWLDSLGDSVAKGTSPTPPYFILADRDYDGLITDTDLVNGSIDGVAANPRTITTLPTLKNAQTDTAGSWIVSIVRDPNDPANPLAKRVMTVVGRATIGTTTKRIQAVYDIELGMSDIFRYAYFVNNYGWFNAGTTGRVYIRGDLRANGDLALSGDMSRLLVDGDLYAARNPELVNPMTNLPAAGAVTGDPTQDTNQATYWNACDNSSCISRASRPTKNLTFPGQPPVGGSQKTLPYGWDSDSPEQKRYEGQAAQPIPYLGNLNFYKSLAIQNKSTLTYYDSAAQTTQTVDATYKGKDGVAGTADDKAPLVLVGTAANPIVLNGPVVIPGDVIIKGVVTGRGTLYAGRNVHVIGQTQYKSPPQWRQLERNEVTGRVARKGYGTSGRSAGSPIFFGNAESNLGTVCNNGGYYASGATLPGGCM